MKVFQTVKDRSLDSYHLAVEFIRKEKNDGNFDLVHDKKS